jgi:hypothetical protein
MSEAPTTAPDQLRLTIENDLIQRMLGAMRSGDLKRAVPGSALEHVYEQVYSQLATMAENARKSALSSSTEADTRKDNLTLERMRATMPVWFGQVPDWALAEWVTALSTEARKDSQE